MTATLDTDSELIGRLERLAPRLRERAAETARIRRIPRASLDDLVDSGMVRMFVPRAHGGSELSVRAYVDATAAVAYGCPSTGWCAGQTAFASLVVAAYPQQAQDAVYADGPDVFLASTAAGLTATTVPGGYRLSGRGPFASGIDHSQWLYLGAPVMEEGRPPEHRFFLLRRDQVGIEDVWHTTAMRGTGSNTVVVDDVFVPEAFTVRHADLREGTGAGASLYDSHLYRLPWVSVVPLIYTATMLGAARAAYDAVVEGLRGKRSPSGARAADSEELQIRVSFAAAKLDGAEAVLHGIADRADSGRPYTLTERAGVMRSASYASAVLAEAADDLLSLAGTSGFADDSIVHQAWRDVHFGAAHQALSKRLAAARFGRLELDVDDTAKPIFY